MEITEFFTWSYLATYTGAAVATGIVTQFLKGAVDKYFSIPTQLLAYVVALVILVLAIVFTGDFSLSSVVLAVFNAVLIAGTTSGVISSTKRIMTKVNK